MCEHQPARVGLDRRGLHGGCLARLVRATARIGVDLRGLLEPEPARDGGDQGEVLSRSVEISAAASPHGTEAWTGPSTGISHLNFARLRCRAFRARV